MTPDQLEYAKTLVPVPPHFQGLGATLLSIDPRDWPVTHHPAIAALLPDVPRTASLMQYVTGSPYDQGPTGACVAASTCGACSIDTQHGLSRWDLFHWHQLYTEAGGHGSDGVDSRLVLKICAEQGTPLALGGRETVIKSYLWVTQQPGQFRQEVKACIAAGFPAVVALLLPSDWGWRSGQPSAGVTQGYHQICGVEYDDDYLVILNSWGNWPGGASPRSGIGSVRWDYLEKDGLQHNYVFAFTTTADALPPPPPPPPPPPIQSAVVTGQASGTGVPQLARGQVYSLSSSVSLTLTDVKFDQNPPPPPNQLTVTGYIPNPVKAGDSFVISGQGFAGGNLTVSWQGQSLIAQRLGDTQIQATAPSGGSTATGAVTVRVEAQTADGPPLTVTAGDGNPGALKVTVLARRYGRGTVGVWAYVQEAGSAELKINAPVETGAGELLPPCVLNPEADGYIAASVTCQIKNGGQSLSLEAHPAQANGTPAVWQISGAPPSPATVTAFATAADGRTGTGTASAI